MSKKVKTNKKINNKKIDDNNTEKVLEEPKTTKNSASLKKSIKVSKTMLVVSGIIVLTLILIFSIKYLSKTDQERINEVIDRTATLDKISYSDDKLNIYLFWGDGCPHCAAEYEFFESLVKKYGDYFHVYGFEIWNSEENYNIFKEFVYYTQDTGEGIPFTVIGDKTYRGFNDGYKSELEDLIVNFHNNSYDIYKEYGNEIIEDLK